MYEFLSTYRPEEYSQSKLIRMEKEEGSGRVRSEFSKILEDIEKCDQTAKLVLMRIICDYIAGMTDSFAQKTYEALYG